MGDRSAIEWTDATCAAGAKQDTLAVVSISGGKDSLATAIIAVLTHGRENVRLVHAWTGHESPITDDYVRNYLPGALGLPIDIVQADFTADLARKRAFIADNWEADGVPVERVRRALELLRPTGIPFLDLCMMKGRFPSRKAQFCTEELKRIPLDAYMVSLARATNRPLEGWQGVRRDESENRRDAQAGDIADWGWLIRRPIVGWTAERVIALAREAGIEQNPLYCRGMKRVGCFPCINCGKDELREIALRFPEEIERVAKWEALVSKCAKRGASTLFNGSAPFPGASAAEIFAARCIEKQAQWSLTSRGGNQLDLERFIPPPACSSVYGLCE